MFRFFGKTYVLCTNWDWFEWCAMIGRLPPLIPRPEKRPSILFQIHQTGLLVTFNRIHQFNHNLEPVKLENLKIFLVFAIQYKFRLRLSNLVPSAEKFSQSGLAGAQFPQFSAFNATLSGEKADKGVCLLGRLEESSDLNNFNGILNFSNSHDTDSLLQSRGFIALLVEWSF